MAAFITTKRVRFQHCDPAGIVFYPQYFLIVNEVVEDWFDGPLGVDWRKLHLDDHLGIPVKKTAAEFFAPSTMGDVLDCVLTVDRVGGSSLALTIRLTCNDQLRAEFKHLLVQMSTRAMKAVPFPEALRARIAAFAAEPPRQ